MEDVSKVRKQQETRQQEKHLAELIKSNSVLKKY